MNSVTMNYEGTACGNNMTEMHGCKPCARYIMSVLAGILIQQPLKTETGY